MVVNAKEALELLKKDAFKVDGFEAHYVAAIEALMNDQDLVSALHELGFNPIQVMIVLEIVIAVDEAAQDDNAYVKEIPFPMKTPPKASC